MGSPSDFKKTGAIWNRANRTRTRLVHFVCRELERCYGTPRLGNPEDPTDDLIYVILSNKTAPETARRTYEAVKEAFTTWEDVVAQPPSTLEKLIKPAGLAGVKAAQIWAALQRMRLDFGRYDLTSLEGNPPEDVERYLVSLPGVSKKVGKCVMMYTMGAEVLPIDSHVHRVARRLGWTARKRADQSHEELEALVPPQRRFAFHVDCIAHGRAVCLPATPLCAICCVRAYCDYYRHVVQDG